VFDVDGARKINILHPLIKKKRSYRLLHLDVKFPRDRCSAFSAPI